MVETVSRLTLIQRAMAMLGVEPIQSLDDSSDASTAAATIYDMVRASCLVHHPWRFTIEKEQLSRLAAAPSNEWTYAHQMPTDRVGQVPVAFFDTDDVGAPPLTEYEVFGDKLFADVTAVYVDYQADVDESLWPPHFATLMAYALAADLAIPLTADMSKHEAFTVRAWGSPSEGGKGGYSLQARHIDGYSSPSQVFEDFGLIAVRG